MYLRVFDISQCIQYISVYSIYLNYNSDDHNYPV